MRPNLQHREVFCGVHRGRTGKVFLDQPLERDPALQVQLLDLAQVGSDVAQDLGGAAVDHGESFTIAPSHKFLNI
jgi:hypothetical protein